MKQKILMFIFFMTIVLSYSQTFSIDNINGHYQWTDNRDTKTAINKQYVLNKNLILFKSGKFVLFDTLVNSENSSDVKYTPEIGGSYEIQNNLLFLIANDKLYIFKIETSNRLKGAMTDYIYLKK